MAVAFTSVRSKKGLEIYSGSLNTLFLHLINYSLNSEGGLQMEAKGAEVLLLLPLVVL